jgi:hypothetical protein
VVPLLCSACCHRNQFFFFSVENIISSEVRSTPCMRHYQTTRVYSNTVRTPHVMWCTVEEQKPNEPNLTVTVSRTGRAGSGQRTCNSTREFRAKRCAVCVLKSFVFTFSRIRRSAAHLCTVKEKKFYDSRQRASCLLGYRKNIAECRARQKKNETCTALLIGRPRPLVLTT